MADVEIHVTGLDRIIKALDKFPAQIAKNMAQAGKEAAEDVILPTRGLRKYPKTTAANFPPTPYYKRGTGTQTASGNLGNSENLGTQFYVKSTGWNTTVIGNRASYAKYVIGEQQAHFMAPKGWRKLFDVAKEKKLQIQKVYQAWVDKTIRELGL